METDDHQWCELSLSEEGCHDLVQNVLETDAYPWHLNLIQKLQHDATQDTLYTLFLKTLMFYGIHQETNWNPWNRIYASELSYTQQNKTYYCS